jgi:hypothetical protein
VNRTMLITVSTLLLFVAAGIAVAQQMEKGNGQIVGVWTLVSEEGRNPDGSKMLPFGPNPNGIVIFEPNGHYALQIIRSGLPKFASNNRTQGTPDENKAVVQGSLSHFGTYSVSDGNVVFHIESSSYPNWSGTESKRPFTMSGDELKWETTPASGGGVAVLVWKRAK